MHATNVRMEFGNPPEHVGDCPWDLVDDWTIAWLGEPLLQWTLSDITDRKWGDRTYNILKQYLAISRTTNCIAGQVHGLVRRRPLHLLSVKSNVISIAPF